MNVNESKMCNYSNEFKVIEQYSSVVNKTYGNMVIPTFKPGTKTCV